MGLVVFVGPVALAVYAIKLEDFGQELDHDLVGCQHPVLLEANRARVVIRLGLAALL